MPTYPLTTLGPTITAVGITIPTYNDILQSLIASFKGIFGSDIVITPDSQDGQMLAIQAKAIFDQNQAIVTIYNSFSPYYAQGTQLSSLVKLSAITRNVPTNSTAVGTVVGTSGAQIVNGVVKDVKGDLWNLPAIVNIPVGGIISVTVTAQAVGAISAQAGDISTVYNPQYGWSSFTNTSAANAGSPVESDAALRRRQALSTSLPAMSLLSAIYSAIFNVVGVTRLTIYENATNSVDANGLPPHSFCPVVEGGVNTAIATAIQSRKPPGIQTFGTTSVTVKDAIGLSMIINYDVLAYLPLYVLVTVQSLAGYTSAIGTELTTAISNFLQSLAIGENAYYSQVNAAGSLISSPDGQTFFIQSLYVGTKGFTGSLLGNTLTVTAMAAGSAPFAAADTIFGINVTPAVIAAFGTGGTSGTGGIGTYIIGGAAQTVLSEVMLAASGGGVANIPVAFNQAILCPLANIQLVTH